MIRFLFSLTAVLLALPAAPAAPRTKDGDRPAAYFPTRVGAKWVYDDGKELVREVTAVEVKRDETIVTVSEHRPKGAVVAERVSISAAGVYRLEFHGFPLDRYCLLKLPAKEGDKWEFDYPTQRDARGSGLRGEKGTVIVGPAENVEVPAGKYRASGWRSR